MDRRSVPPPAVLTAAAGGLVGVSDPAAAAGAKPKAKPNPGSRDIFYRVFTTTADFATGAGAGVATGADALTLASPVGQLTYTDPATGTAVYDYATWTSPSVPLAVAATEAITSWTADTPAGTWIQSELRGVTALGNTTAWYVMGRWTADDATLSRTSLNGP